MSGRRVGWGLWLLAAAVLYLFENNTGTRIILIGSLILPLLSAACTFYTGRHISAKLQVPPNMRKGETVRCTIEPMGTRLSAVCQITVPMEISNPLTGETAESSLTFSGNDPFSFQVTGRHCGCLNFEARKIFLTDPFGIWRFSADCSLQKSIRVYPDSYPVRIRFISEAGGIESGKAGSLAFTDHSASSYGDIREYVPGDPIRQIHWKLSEKLDKTLIREDEPFSPHAVRLSLQTAMKIHDPEGMDRAAEALLSLSESLTRNDRPHEVSWIDRRNDQSVRMEVCADADFAQMRDSLLQTASAVLPLTGQPDPDEGTQEILLCFDPNLPEQIVSRENPGVEL